MRGLMETGGSSAAIAVRPPGWGTVEVRRPAPTEGEAFGLRPIRELCHDLIDPAVTIRALAEAATVEGDLGPSAAFRLRQIAGEARRMAEMCRHALGRPGPAGSVRVDLLAADIVEATRMVADASVELSGRAVTVATREVAVTRVLRNLLDNACRAAGPRGRVRVTVEAVADGARIEVADSGPGWGAAPSGRASLGLDIVSALVGQLGASAWVTESELGGASVVVILPWELPLAGSAAVVSTAAVVSAVSVPAAAGSTVAVPGTAVEP
ncbi:MAG: sensor histidine kinase [Acidimicrobiales bacterium]